MLNIYIYMVKQLRILEWSMVIGISLFYLLNMFFGWCITIVFIIRRTCST